MTERKKLSKAINAFNTCLQYLQPSQGLHSSISLHVSKLKEERDKLPAPPVNQASEYEDSEADRMIDHWNSQY